MEIFFYDIPLWEFLILQIENYYKIQTDIDIKKKLNNYISTIKQYIFTIRFTQAFENITYGHSNNNNNKSTAYRSTNRNN